ncbi:MAG: DNA cytosine methyltransferase, partial [Rickettsia endosymbiont of Labidopullus appendiculatus]|nr:DNA cytosine methyltransferase [Rickettsia endosymbiont of Labidopullus appendiculatus]
MYKFIDLFCGIGGFRIALEEKGMECVFSSDIDKDVQEAYKRN